MNSEASNPDASEKSWLEKIGQLFSGEPRTRGDRQHVLQVVEITLLEGGRTEQPAHAARQRLPRLAQSAP